MDFLAKLVEHEAAAFHWQRFSDTEHADHFQRLVSIGILRHVDNAASISCQTCDTLHSVRAEFLGEGRYRAYCPDVGYYDVDPDQLRVFEPDLPGLAKKVARGLRIPARILTREVIPKFLYDEGSGSSGRTLARSTLRGASTERNASSRPMQLSAQMSDGSPVLTLSTTSWEQTARDTSRPSCDPVASSRGRVQTRYRRVPRRRSWSSFAVMTLHSEELASATTSVRASGLPSLVISSTNSQRSRPKLSRASSTP